MLIRCNLKSLGIFLKQELMYPCDLEKVLSVSESLSIEYQQLLDAFGKVNISDDVLIISGLDVLADDKLEFFIEAILGRAIFVSKRADVPNVEFFKVEPFVEFTWGTLSETSRVGGFHTDFWSASCPPNFVLLQCLAEDPKHPYYGRNQYVSVGMLYEAVEKILGRDFVDTLKIINFTYACSGLNSYQFDNGKILRFHELLINNIQANNELSWLSIIREIAFSVCYDFVLDKGDVVIFNNHHGLHRRGEASISFGESINSYQSRHLNTVRFD